MNLITYKGKIHFEPEDRTKKHINQSSWKKVAIVLLDGDICDYYAWFLKKRFDLSLNKPLRGPHVTFINDRFSDVKGDTEEDKLELWDDIKNKYDNEEISIILNLTYHSNSLHWWLPVDYDHRGELRNIRTELGLGDPYMGEHLTLGRVKDTDREFSDYISRLNKL